MANNNNNNNSVKQTGDSNWSRKWRRRWTKRMLGVLSRQVCIITHVWMLQRSPGNRGQRSSRRHLEWCSKGTKLVFTMISDFEQSAGSLWKPVSSYHLHLCLAWRLVWRQKIKDINDHVNKTGSQPNTNARAHTLIKSIVGNCENNKVHSR